MGFTGLSFSFLFGLQIKEKVCLFDIIRHSGISQDLFLGFLLLSLQVHMLCIKNISQNNFCE